MQIITFQNGLDTGQVSAAVPLHISNRYLFIVVLSTLLVYLLLTQTTPLTRYNCLLYLHLAYTA